MRALRVLLHVLCAIPAAGLIWGAFQGDLGINPVETLLHTNGNWALRILLVCLAITPLRILFKAPWLVTYRRGLGDWAFFYALAHFSVYLVFDASISWSYITDDIINRPYITLGFTGLILLLPLAITSNKWSQRKLGRKWLTLHKLVYPAAIAVVIHFIWLVKGFQLEPLIYAAVLAGLFAVRVVYSAIRRKPAQSS